MNRQARRAAASRDRRMQIAIDQIDSTCDIQVDAEVGQFVMIFANAKGRKVVEDLWPDVKWTTDDIFASVHEPDWLFTHIRVTKLPPNLESKVPLVFASPDALGFGVAATLQRYAGVGRVIYYSGEAPADVTINRFKWGFDFDEGLYAEYAPPGVYQPAGGSKSVH
jgi:hypothetical protein